jgi:hypothetical protein
MVRRAVERAAISTWPPASTASEADSRLRSLKASSAGCNRRGSGVEAA